MIILTNSYQGTAGILQWKLSQVNIIVGKQSLTDVALLPEAIYVLLAKLLMPRRPGTILHNCLSGLEYLTSCSTAENLYKQLKLFLYFLVQIFLEVFHAEVKLFPNHRSVNYNQFSSALCTPVWFATPFKVHLAVFLLGQRAGGNIVIMHS